MINFAEYVIQPPNRYVAQQIATRLKQIDPDNNMGQFGKLVLRYGAVTGRQPLPALKPALIIMCADHGIASYGISAFPANVTIQMIKSYVQGVAGANVFAHYADAKVFIVDVGVNADLTVWPEVLSYKVANGTRDFTKGPAMTYQEAIAGIFAGMKIADKCINQGFNILITGEMGIGNTTSSAALASAFLQLPSEKTVGRGSGINTERMLIKQKIVAKGLEVNNPQTGDALDILQKLGGFEHAGLAGLMLGGAARGIPTVVDGVNATAAALVAVGLCPECKNYLFASHLSREPIHAKLLQYLGLEPVIDAHMRLGEGTGACLFVKILQMALDVFKHA